MLKNKKRRRFYEQETHHTDCGCLIALTIATLYFEVFRNMTADKYRLEGSGTIEVTEIEISSKIAGRVAELPFDEGTQVKVGSLVVKLEYDELSAQRYSARANFVNTEENFKRTKNLYQSGSVSKREYDNAEAAYKIAKAALDQVSASIENAVIYAPISGTVLEKNLEIGEMAFPGSAIITLADLTAPWIKIYVSDKKLGLVKPGQKALIIVDTFPGKKFNGTVVSISSKAEFTPKTIQTKDERVKLMFAVKIAVNNPGLDLKPGMPADAQILLEEKK
jgi:HlyD family secretion protein